MSTARSNNAKRPVPKANEEDPNPSPKKDPMSDPEEQRHFREVVFSFSEYQLALFHEIGRRERHFRQLDRRLLKHVPGGLEGKVQQLDDQLKKATSNQQFLLQIVTEHKREFNLMEPISGYRRPNATTPSEVTLPPLEALPMVQSAHRHVSKLKSTLHQCAREWSSEGKEERDNCFLPIIKELEKWVPISRDQYNQKRVLVPGCGLGRLCVEICGRGYSCQGNEFSYFMLLTSSFILNQLQTPHSRVIYPWIDNPNNVRQSSDMVRPIMIPDKTAVDILSNNPGGDLSMCAGEFMEVYGKQVNHWDSIVTCFFIDTAVNVVEYIETMFNILKPGGVWINHGPLLWHWHSTSENLSDNRFQNSVEFSLDEVVAIAKSVGFEMLNDDFQWSKSRYSTSIRSMMHTSYDIVLFSCRKPL